MKVKSQPAKVKYLFGPGWQDIRSFLKKLWTRNTQAVLKYNNRYSQYGLLSFQGIFWLMCCLSVTLYGTITFAMISILCLSVLSVAAIAEYIGLFIVRAADTLYLKRKKIFSACPECKERAVLPSYTCPGCGEKHSNLTPGKYGILKRTCNCGQKLPVTFMNGRKELDAYCRSCGHPLSDSENVSICIPVIGGRSVGKTAFITAFSRDFINEVAPDKGWGIKPYDEEKIHIYQEIEQDYHNGTTRMTKRSEDISKASSVSFSFFVSGKHFTPDRLVHIYDIAGEVFTDNSENEIQKQYEYCQGIILMIDPFSIPSVRFQYEKELQPEDIAGIGKAETTGIVDSFFNKLREVTGLSANKMLAIPLAVVISKVDVPGLKSEIGKEAAEALISNQSDISWNAADAEDYLCRRFFIRNDMESLINGINMKFKNNRYFSCSSIGHTRDKGEYEPVGIMEPMEWLFQNADPAMKRQWRDHIYSKTPVSLKESMELERYSN